jgi:Zn-dependent protease
MSRGERTFSVVFGILLLGVGVFALGLDHESPMWRFGGGLLLVLLGGNSLFAAYRNRPSWLSRLGPLP